MFIAPSKLFRADKALYFPNLCGVTLAEPKDEQDTTAVAHGKISLVVMFTGRWAGDQTKTFMEGNAKLDAMMQAGKGFLQRIDVNVEQNRMRAALIRLFMGGLRKQMKPEQHDKYFLVTKGFTDGIRENLGMFNTQVGYIYLLDSECRVRWAGSAEALPEEQESMVRGIARLAKELKKQVAEKEAASKGFCEDTFGKSLDDVGESVDRITSIVE